KNVTARAWILLVIMAVGIFLRAWHFHDWLRFSEDQSRDAGIISNVIKGESPLPLLGPVAGGTFFHLGPAYYYFSIVSSKLFGDYPDRMAYPVLFFSILAIPLLYLFLKEYFSWRISLAVTAVASVSYFSVVSSRFSSNPNLAPFFVLAFLYSFLKLLNDKERASFWWPAAIGTVLGIGIQIHTTLLVILPIFTLLMLAYLIKKTGWRAVRYALVIIVLSLAMNAPQIASEIETRGQNTIQFFGGLGLKGSSSGSGLAQGALTAALCQAKANSYFISSFPAAQTCSSGIDFDLEKGAKEVFGGIKDRSFRQNVYLADVSFLFLFSIGGLFFVDL
ncbi:MAG: glycosyltransferase family 39 protein, partial [Candidatus Pacebacteria bacterium]|nr:glycosyltransferase family 39 protein [Candidatus Paceibacterota bacterium]